MQQNPETQRIIPSDFKEIVFVRYHDHVQYNRAFALAMKPQVREAIGWLIYENQDYITISWDRDAEPPTLKGGDAKASGLVLLKSDILELKKLPMLQNNLYCDLNSQAPIVNSEYAFRTSERKTRKNKGETAK